MPNSSQLPSVIFSNQGHLVENTVQPFILALKAGEDLFSNILKCAAAAKLPAASISGIGGLDDIRVAYYNLTSKEYQITLFSGMYELISLNGNISTVEDSLFVHIHAALGRADYSVIGGHIMSATINPSAEITIIPLAQPIYRAYDKNTGLKTMCPIK